MSESGDGIVDQEGYRQNVGIVLCNPHGRVLWARRANRDGWQFPQGGMQGDETAEQALYRELYEEVGLEVGQVHLIGRTRDWLRYDLPGRYVRVPRRRMIRGQKQIWFLLRLLGDDADVRLDCTTQPEFDSWCWVDYWTPMEQVVEFKRDVYRCALTELEPLLRADRC